MRSKCCAHHQSHFFSFKTRSTHWGTSMIMYTGECLHRRPTIIHRNISTKSSVVSFTVPGLDQLIHWRLSRMQLNFNMFKIHSAKAVHRPVLAVLQLQVDDWMAKKTKEYFRKTQFLLISWSKKWFREQIDNGKTGTMKTTKHLRRHDRRHPFSIIPNQQ